MRFCPVVISLIVGRCVRAADLDVALKIAGRFLVVKMAAIADEPVMRGAPEVGVQVGGDENLVGVGLPMGGFVAPVYDAVPLDQT